MAAACTEQQPFSSTRAALPRLAYRGGDHPVCIYVETAPLKQPKLSAGAQRADASAVQSSSCWWPQLGPPCYACVDPLLGRWLRQFPFSADPLPDHLPSDPPILCLQFHNYWRPAARRLGRDQREAKSVLRGDGGDGW